MTARDRDAEPRSGHTDSRAWWLFLGIVLGCASWCLARRELFLTRVEAFAATASLAATVVTIVRQWPTVFTRSWPRATTVLVVAAALAHVVWCLYCSANNEQMFFASGLVFLGPVAVVVVLWEATHEAAAGGMGLANAVIFGFGVFVGGVMGMQPASGLGVGMCLGAVACAALVGAPRLRQLFVLEGAACVFAYFQLEVLLDDAYLFLHSTEVSRDLFVNRLRECWQTTFAPLALAPAFSLAARWPTVRVRVARLVLHVPVAAAVSAHVLMLR